MNPLEQIVKEIELEIDKRKDAIASLKNIPVNLIAEAFPNGRWNYDWLGEFGFTLPYSYALIGVVKEFMVNQFPDFQLRHEFQHVWGEGSAGYFLKYRREDRVCFDFEFRTGREGTTCVLNQIGEKTVPVYEVVCSQAAADEFTQVTQ